MKWRVIKPEKRNGYLNQAIVDAIMQKQNEGKSQPTIFFYQWKPSAVAIGSAQNINKVCNVHECKKLGIDIIRRFSGGGAVYLDSENCFTYSVIAPNNILPKDVKKSYEWAGKKILKVLHGLGLNGTVVGNDVLLGKKKVSGMSQAQKGNSVMVGGTMLMELDWDTMKSVLIFDMEKMNSKGINDPKDAVTGLRHHSDAEIEVVAGLIAKEFTEGNFEFGNITREEFELAKILENEYRKYEWIFKL